MLLNCDNFKQELGKALVAVVAGLEKVIAGLMRK